MEDSYNNIEFIFAKPYKEHYYYYGVNSVETLSVIPKNDLRKLLFEKLNCDSPEEMEYLLSRDLAFVYEVKTKKIRKTKTISADLTQADLNSKMLKELRMPEILFKESPSLSSRCRNLFGR